MIKYEKFTSASQFKINSVPHVMLEMYVKLLKSINLIKMNIRQKYIGQNGAKRFNLIFLITIIITLTISSGCQTSSQDENPIAGVDASGFWFGEFEDNITGKVILDLTQEQSDVSGTIALYEDMPGSFNTSFLVDGFVNDNEITMEDIDPSSDLKVSGQIEGNAMQNGEVTISGDNTTVTATFTATRYPTSSLKVLDKFKAPGKAPYQNRIGSDGNSLWIFDAYDASLIQTEYNGEIIKSLQLSEGCSGMAFENNNIIINTGGQELHWYSKQNGVLLSKLRLDIYGRSIACDNDNLYTIGGYSGDLITFNRSGKTISQKPIIRLNTDMTSNGEFLWILRNSTILKYNKSGDLIHAYNIPDFAYNRETKTVGVIPMAVAFDGTYLWVLAEEVQENFDDPRIIYVYKLSMNPS